LTKTVVTVYHTATLTLQADFILGILEMEHAMAETVQKFEKPPVIETALSVQFSPLAKYTGAHAGWFWRGYLDKLSEPPRAWSQVVEVPKIPDLLERFGSEDVWVAPSLKVTHGVQAPRTQFVRSDNERLIQIQDSRFILNWKKQAADYPSYDALVPEFRTMLHAFEAFAAEARFAALEYNQWEIVYVNQFKKGESWDSPRDWGRIFPGLCIPPVSTTLVPAGNDETMSADLRFSLTNQRGRLYVSLKQMRIPPSNEEVLNVTFTARGPVTASRTWEQGLDLGHEAIREIFLSISSPQAQESWKKRR
jgi:uncharacterized protein (TIGR04255 family)